MRGVSMTLLASSLVLLAAAPANARCNYSTPGCAEWYLDNNGTYHSIRDDWGRIQGRGVRFSDRPYSYPYRYRHARRSTEQ
jgi:hypothetical protein